MEYASEDYTRHYILQALFKLMSENEYERISVKDIAEKAGVGRATFYRHFKWKEDVLMYYLEHNTKKFIYSQRFYPRCKDDYINVVKSVLTMFKENIEPFKLIRKARLEYIYLDYLNKNYITTFEQDYPDKEKYDPYIYAGMLFNVTIAWLDNDCKDTISDLAEIIVNAIYHE